MSYGMPGWKALGFNSYREFLLSDFWKKKRDWILECHRKKKGERCDGCGKSKITLEVHHLNYENLGNEGGEDILILCRDCHQKEHDLRRRI